MKKIITTFCVLTSLFAFSQVGINTTNPESILDIKSTESGILIPRATGNEILSMTVNNLKNGMLVYATQNSTDLLVKINKVGFWYYDSITTLWRPIDSDTKEWQRGNFGGSNVIYNIQASENNTDIAFKDNGSFVIGSKSFDPNSHLSGLRFLIKDNGITSLAVGDYTKASGNNSLAIGTSASADGEYSIALGAQAYATANNSVAIGGQSRGNGANSTAIGNNAKAEGGYSTTIGHYSQASGNYSFAAGYNAYASGNNAVAISYNNAASGSNSFAVGAHNKAIGGSSVTIGLSNETIGNYSFALGTDIKINSDYRLHPKV